MGIQNKCVSLCLGVFASSTLSFAAPERSFADHLRFQVKQGTWMSVDVSPSGQTLIFDLLGHLYTLATAGGNATPITSGREFDSQPKISPDGQRIAFISDRDGADNIWIILVNGTQPQQVTHERHTLFVSPAWTPDGSAVIVSKRTPAAEASGFELFVYPINNGSPVRVTNALMTLPRGQRDNALGVTFSTDGRYLYYAHMVGWMFSPPTERWQLVQRVISTGEETVITTSPDGAFRPASSRDGRWLAYGRRHGAHTGVVLRDLASGEDRWLSTCISRDDQEGSMSLDLLPGYSFLPDSSALILAYGGTFHRIEVPSGKDVTISFTATVERDIPAPVEREYQFDAGPLRARIIQNPALSPDGRSVAFSALKRLYVTDLPSGTLRQIDTQGEPAFQPTWSPDGKWIAYVTWRGSGGAVWKLPSDGSGVPQRLTETRAFYRDVTWTPDGSRLIVLRAPLRLALTASRNEGEFPGSADVLWISAQGESNGVIASAASLWRPHFGPEADRIYFTSSGQLISIRFDGTDRRTQLIVIGDDARSLSRTQASQVILSPTGRSALVEFKHEVYLVSLPQLSESPLSIDMDHASMPICRISTFGMDYMSWDAAGKSLTWSLGATLYRQDLSTFTIDSAKIHPPRQYPLTITIPRGQPHGGPIVLRGAKVITMRGDEVVENADVLVEKNRVIAVEKQGHGTLPPDTRVIDVAGAVIVPGYIDLHPHWWGGLLLKANGILESQAPDLMSSLAYGVTTGRDPATTTEAFAYQDLVDADEMIGPRMLPVGYPIFGDEDFKSMSEVVTVATRYKEFYRAGFIKSYLVGNRQQREWVAEASRQLGLLATTEGGGDFRLDLTHLMDGFPGAEHNLPVTPVYEDVIQLFARSRASWTPTMLTTYGARLSGFNHFLQQHDILEDVKAQRFLPPSRFELLNRTEIGVRSEDRILPSLATDAGAVVRAGGRVCVGSHSDLGFAYHWNIWALTMGDGLTRMQAIRAATLSGAQALGLGADLGSVEPGKLADLVVLNGDPLVDITNTADIRYVMKDGELFDGETLEQLWPQHRNVGPAWWDPGNPDLGEPKPPGSEHTTVSKREFPKRPGVDHL